MPVQTLAETLTSLALGVGGTVGTNLENVVVALAAFCSRVPAAALAVGFFGGLAFLLVFSWLSAMAIALLPTEYLGFLGIMPILMGLRELLRGAEAPSGEPGDVDRKGVVWAFGAVALVMIVNGVDTVAVFAPLLAESEITDRIVISAGYLLASGLLAWVCVYACSHPLLARPIERYGNRLAPFVMIGIGVYILMNTSTDSLL